MKYLLLILLNLFAILSIAQTKKTTGIANAYTLTEADGFPGNNYVTHAEFSSRGKIYIKDFFGNLHSTGNNFYKKITAVKNISNNAQIYLQSDNELWLSAEGGNMSIIKNDTLYKQVLFQNINNIIISNWSHKFYYLFKQVGNYIEVYKFNTDKWVLLNKATWDSTIKINYFGRYFLKANQTFIRTIIPKNKEALYLFDTLTKQFKYINTIPKVANDFYQIFYNNNWEINSLLEKSVSNFYFLRTGKHFKADNNFEMTIQTSENSLLLNYQNNFYEYANYDSTHILPNSFIFETDNKLNQIQKNPYHPSYLVLTNNKPVRIFPYIKKYPSLFQQKKSANINAIVQDDAGNIWAGSYENNLSILSPTRFTEGFGARTKELPKQPYAFMNAAINYNNKLYFVGETQKGGILQYDAKGNMHKLKPQTPNGFYLYYAPRSKTIWMPSAEEPNLPIYTCHAEELDKQFIHWQKLDTVAGIKPFGFSTMTEDSLQRIWIGHPKKGFAVYNQKTKKAITYDLQKNETHIGFISCVTDSKGTVFMGTDDKGLWYYNDYLKLPTPQNIYHIQHPLLNHTVRITSMCIYENWLVIGCYNKICLLNLDSFYIKKKAIVRYLSPQESNFTSITEQNTMLVSKKDSTLWFGTSDMLYQWDIKKWLQIPTYKVNLKAFIKKDSVRNELSATKNIRFKPSETSFDLVFEYLSKDGLPRYTRTSLAKEGDSIIYSEPNLQSKFSFKDLSSGNYTFYIEVFEQNGSTSQYVYEFTINKFLWQQWWFLVLASFLFITPFILWLNSLRKEAIQQKIISQLNIVTLSSQFRPHFILNVLNTIGADLINKPAAETVISRLGESINLIFNQAQQKSITHSLRNEWVLVQNVITIHRIMYIPELQVIEPEAEWLFKNSDLLLPVGIIEIMVENALLHGLRNKIQPPYVLKIETSDDETNFYFKITDNGIGRSNAMQLSSYKKHGTGTKNLNAIIKILNKFNKNIIEIIYKDCTTSDDENRRTTISIIIPKHYIYEY